MVILAHSAAKSGGEIALGRVAPLLAEEIDLLVVSFEDGPLVDDLRAAGVEAKVVPLPESARRLRRRGMGTGTFRGLVGLLGIGFDPQLRAAAEGRTLYSNSQKAHVAAAMLRLGGHPGPWVLHQREYVSAESLGVLASSVAQAVAVGASCVVANSVSTARSVRLVRQSKKVVIPSPVDIDGFARPRTESPERPLRVLMVASVVPQKGADILLDALDLLPPSVAVVTTIAGQPHFGDFDYLDRLRAQAGRMTSESGEPLVQFAGHVDDVASLMARSHVLVAPSRHAEGMGQVIVQARAARLPVIASDIPGYRDLVDPGLNGLLVPPDDPRALAEAITLMSDPRFSARLRPASDPALAAFEDRAVVAQMLAALADVQRGARGT